ncbi:MAG: glycogen/starch synthase, partial [Rhodothermales bacterium]|nr:glycogen/starch synthase [Rhodothermales bacterium]
LGWAPDVVHAFGWASAFVPLLLTSEFGDDPLFENTKTIYSPDDVDPKALFDAEMVDTFGLETDSDLIGGSLCDVGLAYADALAYPQHVDPPSSDIPQFSQDLEQIRELGSEIYEQVASGVAV